MAASIGCDGHVGHNSVRLKSAHALVVLVLVVKMQKVASMILTGRDLSFSPRGHQLRFERDKKLFAISLVHPHHVDSPYMNSNLTLAQRVEHSLESSVERWNYLAHMVNGMDNKMSIPLHYSGKGFYHAQIIPGTQDIKKNRKLWVVMDTGSDLLWVRCLKPGEQNDIVFNRTASSSYVPILYKSQPCQWFPMRERSSSDPPTCRYIYSYDDNAYGGSYTKGEVAYESFSFPNPKSKDENKVEKAIFGCADEISNAFHATSGLVGLGRGTMSLTSQLNITLFSYCLVDYYAATSVSNPMLLGSLGDIPLSYTPLYHVMHLYMSSYYIRLKGISVDGEPVHIPPDAFDTGKNNTKDFVYMFVDIGVTITKMVQQLYEQFAEAVHKSINKTLTKVNQHEYIKVFDYCYNITRKEPTYPKVVFHFENKLDIDLSGKNSFLDVHRGSLTCFAYRGVPTRLNVLGNIQQMGMQIGVDLEKSHMGFAPKICGGHGSK